MITFHLFLWCLITSAHIGAAQIPGVDEVRALLYPELCARALGGRPWVHRTGYLKALAGARADGITWITHDASGTLGSDLARVLARVDARFGVMRSPFHGHFSPALIAVFLNPDQIEPDHPAFDVFARVTLRHEVDHLRTYLRLRAGVRSPWLIEFAAEGPGRLTAEDSPYAGSMVIEELPNHAQDLADLIQFFEHFAVTKRSLDATLVYVKIASKIDTLVHLAKILEDWTVCPLDPHVRLHVAGTYARADDQPGPWLSVHARGELGRTRITMPVPRCDQALVASREIPDGLITRIIDQHLRAIHALALSVRSGATALRALSARLSMRDPQIGQLRAMAAELDHLLGVTRAFEIRQLEPSIFPD